MQEIVILGDEPQEQHVVEEDAIQNSSLDIYQSQRDDRQWQQLAVEDGIQIEWPMFSVSFFSKLFIASFKYMSSYYYLKSLLY